MVGMREKPATFLVLAGGSRWFTCGPTGSKTVGIDMNGWYGFYSSPGGESRKHIAPSFETDHHRVCLVNCSVFSLWGNVTTAPGTPVLNVSAHLCVVGNVVDRTPRSLSRFFKCPYSTPISYHIWVIHFKFKIKSMAEWTCFVPNLDVFDCFGVFLRRPSDAHQIWWIQYIK